jgi:hypothetical protein
MLGAAVMAARYVVLEYAGQVDERAFADFGNLDEARSWMSDAYDPMEIDLLNVRVVREVDGVRIEDGGRLAH